MSRIRNSAKAIIIREDQLLVIQKKDELGDYFILPGGGQHHGELLQAAVRREVNEETSLDVNVGDLLFIRDYISANHEFASSEPDAHQVEFMFNCRIAGQGEARMGDEPDDEQIGIRWLPLADLLQHRLYPLALRPFLLEKVRTGSGPIYLGDIN